MPSEAFSRTLDALINKHEYKQKVPAESHWLDEGERYTVLEPSAANAEEMDLVAYETATGKRTVLVGAKQLIPSGANKPISIEDYHWSADKTRLLIFTNSQKVWRANTRGDYWVLHLPDGKLTRLGADAPPSSLMFAKFSPDGRSVAYVRENNLYVEDLSTGKPRELTKDGSSEIINGTSDWVNEEELFLRDAFRWSPDSQSIAYWQFDQSGVQEYTLINDTKELYPQTFRYKYPQAGTTNSAVRVGVVSVQGGDTRWVKLPGDPRNQYVPRMDWVGDSDEIAVELLNRLQNDDRVFLANARTGDVRLLFEDKDAAYLDTVDTLSAMPDFTWIPQSRGKTAAAPERELLWLSERDGWRHAYLVSRATGQLRLITNFPGDVIGSVDMDEAAGYYYFTASPSDPIRRYLYRSRLDGSGTPERLTPGNQSGIHDYTAAPNGLWALHTYTSAAHPPIFDVVQLRDHKVMRTLETNEALAKKAQSLVTPPVEFTETPVGNGVRLSTVVIKPPDFDPAKKYPVFVSVYGEPWLAIVQDKWDLLYGHIFSQAVAREGYIVLGFDNEGTPAPRGRAWRKAGYGAIGVLSTQEQAAAIREFAREHPYVDTQRMAIWGWSGGGTNTLNMMFRYPGLFSTGIAVAPVPDQTRYDTIYQERYMGLPAENAKGYHDGSAINFAGGLTGNLLIIHGSGDDNVHFQGTELLVNKLIELGKPFTFMDYPNRTHSISEGPGTSLHVHTLIVRYLEEHVPPGPLPR